MNQKFTGQERDAETNLDFFQARYMSAGLGRFLSPDPANAGADLTNPQSWNGYGYVVGNPLAMVDPDGADFGSVLNWIGGLWTTVSGWVGGESNNPFSGPTYYATGYCQGCDNGSVSGGSGPSHEGGGSSTPNGGNGSVPTYTVTGTGMADRIPPTPPKTGTPQSCDDSTNNRSRFFQYLPGMLDVAKQLSIPNNYIVGLASYESGWLDDHNAKLNNLWGLTQAGGNNISFSSMQVGNQYFVTNVGPFIQGTQTVPTFFSGLKKEGYNSVNPNYFSMNPRKGMLFNRISNIQKWGKACNASF